MTTEDALYIDIRARTENIERSLREIEGSVRRSGQQISSTLSSAIAGGVAGVAATVAASLGAALAGLPAALKNITTEADRVNKSHEMFIKTLDRLNVSSKEASDVVEELQSRLKLSPDVIEASITTILRAGGSLESAAKGLLGAGASAAAAGVDIAKAVENASVGLAMGRSELMEYAGIIVNASDAYKDYAKQINTSVDALTNAQKVEAYAAAVAKESAMEIEDLQTALSGLTGSAAESALAMTEFRNNIGQALIPVMSALNDVMSPARNNLLGFSKSLSSDSFKPIADTIRSLAGHLDTLGKNDSIKTFANNITTFGLGAVKVLTTMAKTISDVLMPLMKALVPVVGSVIAGLSPLFRAFGELFSTVADTFKRRWEQEMLPLWRGFVPVIAGVLSILGQTIRAGLDNITNTLTTFTALLRGDWESVWKGLETYTRNAITSMINIVKNGAKELGQAFNSLKNGIQESVQNRIYNLTGGLLGTQKAIEKKTNNTVISQPTEEIQQRAVAGKLSSEYIASLKDVFKNDPKAASDCASIAYQILENIGLGIKHGTRQENWNAATLEKNAIKSGYKTVPVSEMKPGDLVVWTSGNGKQYGLVSGKHVGVAVDSKTIINNPGNRNTVVEKMYDRQNATVYRAPNSPYLRAVNDQKNATGKPIERASVIKTNVNLTIDKVNPVVNNAIEKATAQIESNKLNIMKQGLEKLQDLRNLDLRNAENNAAQRLRVEERYGKLIYEAKVKVANKERDIAKDANNAIKDAELKKSGAIIITNDHEAAVRNAQLERDARLKDARSDLNASQKIIKDEASREANRVTAELSSGKLEKAQIALKRIEQLRDKELSLSQSAAERLKVESRYTEQIYNARIAIAKKSKELSLLALKTEKDKSIVKQKEVLAESQYANELRDAELYKQTRLRDAKRLAAEEKKRAKEEQDRIKSELDAAARRSKETLNTRAREARVSGLKEALSGKEAGYHNERREAKNAADLYQIEVKYALAIAKLKAEILREETATRIHGLEKQRNAEVNSIQAGDAKRKQLWDEWNKIIANENDRAKSSANALIENAKTSIKTAEGKQAKEEADADSTSKATLARGLIQSLREDLNYGLITTGEALENLKTSLDQLGGVQNADEAIEIIKSMFDSLTNAEEKARLVEIKKAHEDLAEAFSKIDIDETDIKRIDANLSRAKEIVKILGSSHEGAIQNVSHWQAKKEAYAATERAKLIQSLEDRYTESKRKVLQEPESAFKKAKQDLYSLWEASKITREEWERLTSLWDQLEKDADLSEKVKGLTELEKSVKGINSALNSHEDLPYSKEIEQAENWMTLLKEQPELAKRAEAAWNDLRKAQTDAINKNLSSELDPLKAKLADLNGIKTRAYNSELTALEKIIARYGMQNKEVLELYSAYKQLALEEETKIKRLDEVEKKLELVRKTERELLTGVPAITNILESFNILSSSMADAWNENLNAMIKGISSLTSSLAKGDWLGAIVGVFQNFINWINRNKRAAENEAKSAADYNKQFKWSDQGYNTRSVEKYTTGFWIFSTDHYNVKIDEVKKNLALSLESGFTSGIQNGFREALAQNDFSLFAKSLRSSVADSVINGLVEAFMNTAVIKSIMEPAIQRFLDTGSVNGIDSAINSAVKVSEDFFNKIKPIYDKIKGQTSEANNANAMSDNSNKSLFGNAPTMQLGIPRLEISLPSSMQETLKDFTSSVIIFDSASKKMLLAAEQMLAASGGLPSLSNSRGLA